MLYTGLEVLLYMFLGITVGAAFVMSLRILQNLRELRRTRIMVDIGEGAFSDGYLLLYNKDEAELYERDEYGKVIPIGRIKTKDIEEIGLLFISLAKRLGPQPREKKMTADDWYEVVRRK